MICRNADEAYAAMARAVERFAFGRESSDGSSPCRVPTSEAMPGSTFVVAQPKFNLVTHRPIDLRWAKANALHFFAGVEEAAPLLRVNRFAEKFLVGTKWVGAYGAVAMPQVRRCVELLRRSPMSRRSVVSMGGLSEETVNSPACWSFLHFLLGCDGLDLLVYQRSLNLVGVMPYDCVLLCNVLLYVASEVGVEPGRLRWVVGSLHVKVGDAVTLGECRDEGLLLSPEELRDPWGALEGVCA